MTTRLCSTLAAAAAMAAIAAAPGHATVIEKGSFSNEAYGFSYDCGFPVQVTGEASGNYRLRAGTGKDASAFFGLDRIAFREIHTNAATGQWFSLSGRFLSNEVKATRLDGSLFEIRSIKAGQPAVITDSTGNLVARDTGVLHRTIVFDTGGDDEPGGTFVDLLSLHLSGRQPSFGRLCDIATELIG